MTEYLYFHYDRGPVYVRRRIGMDNTFLIDHLIEVNKGGLAVKAYPGTFDYYWIPVYSIPLLVRKHEPKD